MIAPTTTAVATRHAPAHEYLGAGGVYATCTGCTFRHKTHSVQAALAVARAHVATEAEKLAPARPESIAEAKAAGQQASLWDATQTDADVTRQAIATIKPGAVFSMNDVRHIFDDHNVERKMRGGLLRDAIGAGWIEPVMSQTSAGSVASKIPSTDPSAKGAFIVEYRRTHAPVEVS